MIKINDLKYTRNQYQLYKEAYRYWQNMHYRVEHSKNYTSVSICNAWYAFGNFYAWFEPNYENGWQLDKDLLSGTIYSPDTCLFVPNEVNQLFRKFSTSLMKGVVRNHKGYQAQISINGVIIKLGTYPTVQEAHEEYVLARKERCLALSNQYSNYTVLSSVLYDYSK